MYSPMFFHGPQDMASCHRPETRQRRFLHGRDNGGIGAIAVACLRSIAEGVARIWVNYNDLTATSLESWLIRGIIPKWP